MSRSREGEGSPGSLNHSLPVRSHTYMRPVVSKVIPTASGHGPEIMVSVNPGGTVAAKRLPPQIIPHAATTNHVIAVSRLIRRIQPAANPMREVAQITRGLRPFLSMNDIRCELSSPWQPASYKDPPPAMVVSSVATLTARRSSRKCMASRRFLNHIRNFSLIDRYGSLICPEKRRIDPLAAGIGFQLRSPSLSCCARIDRW